METLTEKTEIKNVERITGLNIRTPADSLIWLEGALDPAIHAEHLRDVGGNTVEAVFRACRPTCYTELLLGVTRTHDALTVHARYDWGDRNDERDRMITQQLRKMFRQYRLPTASPAYALAQAYIDANSVRGGTQ